MLRTIVNSPWTKILIIESWLYLGLRWELDSFNIACILFALLVLSMSRLQNIFFEMVLVFLCPLVFFHNSGSDLIYQSIPLFYLVLMVLILKQAQTPKERQIKQYVVAADRSQVRSRQYGANALNLKDRPRLKKISDPLSEIYTTSSRTQRIPPKRSFSGIRLPRAALLMLLLGFVVGYMRFPGPRISLSFQNDGSEYFSYLKPKQSSVAVRDELYAGLEASYPPASGQQDSESLLKLFTFETFVQIDTAISSFFYELDREQLPVIDVAADAGGEEADLIIE